MLIFLFVCFPMIRLDCSFTVLPFGHSSHSRFSLPKAVFCWLSAKCNAKCGTATNMRTWRKLCSAMHQQHHVLFFLLSEMWGCYCIVWLWIPSRSDAIHSSTSCKQSHDWTRLLDSSASASLQKYFSKNHSVHQFNAPRLSPESSYWCAVLAI